MMTAGVHSIFGASGGRSIATSAPPRGAMSPSGLPARRRILRRSLRDGNRRSISGQRSARAGRASSQLPHDGPAADRPQAPAVQGLGISAPIVAEDEYGVARDEDLGVVVGGLMIRGIARGRPLAVHKNLTLDHLDPVTGKPDHPSRDLPRPLPSGDLIGVGDEIVTVELVGLVDPG